MMKACLIFLALFCSTFYTYAQLGTELISVDYFNADIRQVTDDLKTKTGYQFFYQPMQLDSFRVTLAISQKSMVSVLKNMFVNTPYHFVITADREVILTKDQLIDVKLAQSFVVNRLLTPVTDTIQIFESKNSDAPPDAASENRLYEIGYRTNQIKTGTAELSGFVRNLKNGQPLTGISIIATGTQKGVATDEHGYYRIALNTGRHTLLIKGIGMIDTKRLITLYSSGKLNISLRDRSTVLKEVTITADKLANVRSLEMGVNKIDIKSIKQIPTVFGEADVLRVVLTLPGVQTVGEATTGFNVRGGSADQNLILLNNATIYNPSHFFGFFSAFNPDIVKDIELYKSTIPERFGGRLSSVLDVTDREGNKKVLKGSAGIGLLTSRFNIEGPIIKNKTSFIFGVRTTYSDWLLKLLPQNYKNSSASFYDLNFDISHNVNKNNTLYLTTYLSHDNFKLNSDTAYSYSNRNANIKWRHDFSNRLYGTFVTGLDDYRYDVSSSENPINAYRLKFSIGQTNLKADFNYYLTHKNTFNFGVSSIYYRLNPGDYEPYNDKSLVVPNTVAAEQALESAMYFGDKMDITPELSINTGIRYSLYNYLGAQIIDNYASNLPKSASTVTDSTVYGNNKVINTYHGPEIRISARYSFGNYTSVKASYNTLRQYIHLLSNTTAISPTDTYKLSDPNIKPQFGQQLSFGLYHNTKANAVETSIEIYYKKLQDYLDYKSGATLLLNQHIERDVVSTQGKAYGAEFLIRKNSGSLNGWVSYTYSRTFLRQDDPQGGPLINNGNYYPANYDKPHSLNFTGNYRFSQRFSVSMNVLYSTGRPITYPVTEYYYGGAVRVLYSDRNAFRIPDYFRSDFAMNIDGNHKIHQRFHNSFTIGVYNLTGRANAYSTFFAQQGGIISGYQLSIFAVPIPFVNYNIRF